MTIISRTFKRFGYDLHSLTTHRKRLPWWTNARGSKGKWRAYTLKRKRKRK